ncbi:MAG: S8 family serine peptidase [Saprospiraceae bacterium]|nr:S8 family serine peptidase [Saprospiraceae bacterium]
MRLLLAFLLTFSLVLPNAFTQSAEWRAKIESRLWNPVQHPDTVVEFLIILQKQADLSAARQLRKKEEKGRYVFETLSNFAETDQRGVRDLLAAENAPMHSFWIINAIWAKGNAALIEKLAQMPEVGRLEANPVWRLSRPPADAGELPVEERALNPWGIGKINANDVWDMGFEGDGIVIGGQDTGYEWEHPAIKAKYRGWDGDAADHNYNWHDAIRVLINGGPNSCGLDLIEPCDDDNHGTHTMGTMVGSTSSDSMIGVAPQAKWIGCRNMEEGDGTPATYIECFEWFVAPTDLDDENPDASRAPHVINNSWGCPVSEGCNAGNYATMEATVNNVRAAGIVVVVSAGNSGPNCSTVNTPAAIYESSFSVGATDNGDNIANFSSRGPVNVYTAIMKPDISAPGVGVASCIGRDNNPATYSYASWNGTSMAGPHVAGAAALVMNARPDLIGDVDAIENVLEQSAVDRFDTAPFCGNDNGSSLPNNVFGWGRLDVQAAVNAALPVTLLEFNATAKDETAALDWLTGLEQDCAHFTVQRSADGFIWENLGELACRGNHSPGETRYVFTDLQPHKGLNYYRLQQTDYSGFSTLSPVRALSFSTTGYSLRVSSGRGQAYFEVIGEDADEQSWRLEIRSAEGRLVQQISVGAKGWLHLSDAPAGVYTILLRDADNRALALEKWWWTK